MNELNDKMACIAKGISSNLKTYVDNNCILKDEHSNTKMIQDIRNKYRKSLKLKEIKYE